MSGTAIRLHSGHMFDFMDIENAFILIGDIAHALSHTCRYGGHCPQFYSVAQHSVLVSHLVPREHAVHALLHDAAEAYLGDVVKPLKNLLPDYLGIERRLEREIFKRFYLPEVIPECVKSADVHMLNVELNWLWHPVDGSYLEPQDPSKAKAEFLKRYEELKHK